MSALKTAVRCRIFSTGYCPASESHLIRGGRRTLIYCQALVALLEHPAEGSLLFDTGYAFARMQSATARLPYRIYRRTAPFITAPEQCAAAQICDPKAIRMIILSHFHPDHLSGLADFPEAKVIATRTGYEAIAGRRGFAALRRGFLPDLLPNNFPEQATLLETPFTGEPLPHLGPTHDLFGDGLLRLVSLPGHARGQIGLFMESENGPLFFVADAAYLRRSIRENRPPHPITNLFTEGAATVADTLSRLHAFTQERPDVRIIPTHCPEAYAEITA